MKTALIGHRNLLPRDIGQRLEKVIQKEIELGCRSFIMGTHGDFDREALGVVKSLRAIYPDLKIEVVITNVPKAQPDLATGGAGKTQNDAVTTVMYEIEEVHYKQRITASNRKMIDACDTLICYVRPYMWRSGAAAIMEYAQAKGLKIVNLYNPDDG